MVNTRRSHTHTHTHTHTSTCASFLSPPSFLHTHIHTHACTHTHARTHTHTHTHVRTHAHRQTCAHTHTHAHTHMRVRTCTQTHACARTHTHRHTKADMENRLTLVFNAYTMGAKVSLCTTGASWAKPLMMVGSTKLPGRSITCSQNTIIAQKSFHCFPVVGGLYWSIQSQSFLKEPSLYNGMNFMVPQFWVPRHLCLSPPGYLITYVVHHLGTSSPTSFTTPLTVYPVLSAVGDWHVNISHSKIVIYSICWTDLIILQITEASVQVICTFYTWL